VGALAIVVYQTAETAETAETRRLRAAMSRSDTAKYECLEEELISIITCVGARYLPLSQ